MWLWFQKIGFPKLGSPRWFYHLSGKWLPWLAGAMALFMLVGITWALLFVPADYQQGETIRIMYIHVPFASVALSFFPMMAVAGAVTLVWGVKLADMLVKTAAPLGVGFTGLALASGSIWGSDIWGAWWVWDGRLTSMLFQLFLLMGVVSLRSALTDDGQAAKACGLLSIVGCINAVVIKYSVDWWNTLHQPAGSFSMSANAPNAPEIWLPLVLMIVAVYLLLVLCLIMGIRNEILLREWRAQWVQDEVQDLVVGKEMR